MCFCNHQLVHQNRPVNRTNKKRVKPEKYGGGNKQKAKRKRQTGNVHANILQEPLTVTWDPGLSRYGNLKSQSFKCFPTLWSGQHYPRILQNACAIQLSLYGVCSLTRPTAILVVWNKRKILHKNRVQFPEDWFTPPTWPLFLCFAPPTWLPWRHVNTLYRLIIIVECFVQVTWKMCCYTSGILT